MPDYAGENPDIVRVLDKRLDVRYVGAISGSYTLSDRRDASNEVEVFACRTQSLSVSAAALTAPVTGDIGERMTARLDGIGILRGHIDRPTNDGFVFQIVTSEPQKRRLAAKIAFLKKSVAHRDGDKRAFRRFQPTDPRTTLRFQDGRVVKCFVIDLSRGGAALSAHFKPEIGEPVVIGALQCHVVRHLAVGFAVEFDASQDAEGLEQLATGYEPLLRAEPLVWPSN